MSQKLLVNGFECVEAVSNFDECFIKSYNEESNEGYFLEVNTQYLENLHNLIANLHDKIEYDIRIKNLKQTLDHGLILKKFKSR